MNTLLARLDGLQIPLRKHVTAGRVRIQPVDPAEFSPSQLARSIKSSVETDGAVIVVIDSLNGYLNSMPEENFLVVQLHELLTYLGQMGVASLLVSTHQGIIGTNVNSPVDASYVADAVVLLAISKPTARCARPSRSSRCAAASTSVPRPGKHRNPGHPSRAPAGHRSRA